MVEFVSNEQFREKFNQLLKDSIEVAIGSAFINIEGLQLLTEYLKKVGEITNKKIRILLSEKFHEKKEIRKKILDELIKIPNVGVKIYLKENIRFHAKIFIFSTEDEVNILTGSYNLTGAGVNRNIEAGYLVSGDKEDAVVKDAIEFFNNNWEESIGVREFIEKESQIPEAKFKKGDKVYVIANPNKKGVVQEDPVRIKSTFLYSIFFSVEDISNYKEEQLSLLSKVDNNNILSLMLKNKFADAQSFIQSYTLLKLDNPLTDQIYAFMSSRTEFNTYQFKPVLKLLNSPFQRLLIADEVGVGKTIEAGIIYTELKARKELERVLVVCPHALMPKWKSEMKSRFDENFEIISSERLKYILNESSKGLDITNLKGICSIQLLRMEGYLSKLKESPLYFDLVIVDEAHHMRNKGNSYDLGECLSYKSDALIFLTATPLQLGQEDFFNLMHLLLPDEFKDFGYFQKIIEPNQYLNAVYRLLKSKEFSNKDVLELLSKVETTELSEKFSLNPDYNNIKEILSSQKLLDSGDIISIQKKLNELNPLTYAYTRTKKREVMTSPIREPHKIQVSFSEKEKEFYDLAIKYAKYKFNQRNLGNQQGVGFATIMIQRQVASCIPAMVSYLKDILKNRNFEQSSEDDSYLAEDSDIDEMERANVLDKQEIQMIKEMIQIGNALGNRDTKFDAFLKTLERLIVRDEISGIMVFSYFRKTLEYLKDKLTKQGYKVGLIYGGIDLDEREIITEQMRNQEIQILLSSEVGGEGLDFQFCNCMVNYDLPWNPMKVEQRIGRLDRYGQTSPKVLIYNFSVEDTVESRIFGRLYERIKIFEKYIGELEGILGKEISDLTKLIVSTELTPEQEEQKIREIQQIIELKGIEMKEFDKERSKFLGQDDYFNEEITSIKQTNRFITPDEIENLLKLFLSEFFPKTRLDFIGNNIYEINPDNYFSEFLLETKMKLQPVKRQELSSFIKKIEKGITKITFDSKQACMNKGIEFITIKHPLLKAIVSFLKEKGKVHLIGRIIITNEKFCGTYVFFTYLISINAAKTILELHTVTVDTETLEVNMTLSEEFSKLIYQNRSYPLNEGALINPIVIKACEQKSLEFISTLQDKKEKELQKNNNYLIDSQIESQKAFFKHKIAQAERRLEDNPDERIVRMKSAEIQRLENELKSKLSSLEKKRLIDISFNLVAGGILEVKKSHEN